MQGNQLHLDRKRTYSTIVSNVSASDRLGGQRLQFPARNNRNCLGSRYWRQSNRPTAEATRWRSAGSHIYGPPIVSQAL